MVKTCIVKGCSNKFIKDSGIHFFLFPFKRPEVLNEWAKAMNRKDFVPKRHQYVCSVHFEKEDFTHNPGSYKKYLKEQAVPTIFPWGRIAKPKIISTSTASKASEKLPETPTKLVKTSETSPAVGLLSQSPSMTQVRTSKTSPAKLLSEAISTSPHQSSTQTPAVLHSSIKDNANVKMPPFTDEKGAQTDPVICFEQPVQTTAEVYPKAVSEYRQEIRMIGQKLRRRNRRIQYLTNFLKKTIDKLKKEGLVNLSLEEMLQDNFEGMSLNNPCHSTSSPQPTSSPLLSPVSVTPTSSAAPPADNIYIISVNSVSTSAPSTNNLFLVSVEPEPTDTPPGCNSSGFLNSSSSELSEELKLHAPNS